MASAERIGLHTIRKSVRRRSTRIQRRETERRNTKAAQRLGKARREKQRNPQWAEYYRGR